MYSLLTRSSPRKIAFYYSTTDRKSVSGARPRIDFFFSSLRIMGIKPNTYGRCGRGNPLKPHFPIPPPGAVDFPNGKRFPGGLQRRGCPQDRQEIRNERADDREIRDAFAGVVHPTVDR
jgi:hypothetical protein